MAPSTKARRPDTDEVGQASNAWIPAEPGETLEGELIEVRAGWSDYREREYPILVVRSEEGEELTFHAFRSVPHREVIEKQPLPGERIRIAYLGPGRAKQGRSAPELYRLTVEGRSAEESARRTYARLAGGRREPATAPEQPAGTPEAGPDEDQDFPF
jgi:hypothetical protein